MNVYPIILAGKVISKVVRRILERRKKVKRVKAAFRGLIDTKASESYLFWSNLVVSIGCHLNAGICETVNTVTNAIFGADFAIVSAGMATYVLGRMVSKGSKSDVAEPVKE